MVLAFLCPLYDRCTVSKIIPVPAACCGFDYQHTGSSSTQRWASTLANRSNARHRSNIRAPLPQMYASKKWESVWPEGQEAIHS